jgi:hypothetical protein
MMQSTPFSRASLKQLFFFAVGMLASMVLILLLPHSSQTSIFAPAKPVADSKSPLLWQVLVTLVDLLHLPTVQVAAFLMVLLLAWRRREHPDSWLAAFLAGFVLPGILRLLL